MWQQTLVAVWIQFAVGAAAILGVTSLALRWIAQPAERARLIQFMLAAVLVLPLISALAPFPSWNLGLISRATIASPPEDDPFQDISVAADVDRQADSSADVGGSGAPATEPQDAAMSPFDARDDFRALRAEPPATAPSSPSSLALRFTSIDAWLALALAIILAHAAAAIYILAQRAIGKTQLQRLCRAASDAPESVDRAWQAIAGSRACGVRLLVSSEVEAPLVFGWLRPVVMIPREIAAENGRALACCLAHEWSHIERADMLSWRFVNLCQFVLWYQPAFWTLRRELRICQEFLADNRSAKGALGSIEYSELLLGLAKRRRGPGVVGALTMFDQPSQLARRIRMLLENHVPLSVRCRRPFTCCVLAVSALLATTISAVRVDSIQADVEAAKPVAPAATKAADSKETETAKPIAPTAANAAEPTKDEKPVAQMMSYTQLMTVGGQKQPIKTKDFIAQDGRKRTEHFFGVGPAGTTTSIFDAMGLARLILNEDSKTAIVYAAKENRNFGPPMRFLDWLERLKKLGDDPDKDLGHKEVDGKQASGFVATQSARTYTMWFDDATGDAVRIEYDTSVNAEAAHIVMTDFRFREKLDESLFSLAVPEGYNVWQPPVKPAVPGGGENRQAEVSARLEPSWSRKGKWFAAAGDPKTPILYALRGGEQLNRLSKMNASGEEISTTKIDDYTSFLRVVNLTRTGEPDLLTFSTGGPTVKAHRTDGKLLWYTAEASANDVCAADLNNDGLDEVIVAYNGDLGLHALDQSGQLLWKYATIHVDRIAAGNIEGDERPEIVTTSSGKVHVFNAEGKHLRELKPGLYAQTVRVWETADKNPSAALIVVAGTDASEMTTIAALDSQGTIRWSLERSNRLVNAAICRTLPWLAMTLTDGSVRVIDVVAGKEIAQVGGQGKSADAAWLRPKDGAPQLVVATGEALHAYRIPAAQP